jgi:hypothetical protein
MQQGYRYLLSEREGKNFDARFTPDLSPQEMLALGVFSGKYMTDCRAEFPVEWFTQAKLSPARPDPQLNFFKLKASQPLSVWRARNWIYHEDSRGWFQWYCRYYLGRRIPPEDERQIRRWLAMRRHIAQLQKNCRTGDLGCQKRRRQALLHWAYDSRKL